MSYSRTSRDAVRVSASPMLAQAGLADCSLLYAKALTNPFGLFEELPCVPSSPPMMTYRYRLVSRGTFTTPPTANLYGFVAVAPFQGANNVNSIWTSTAAYAGLNPFAVGGTGVTPSTRALPFATAAFDGIQGRLVGLGLRVRNITQALNVGGMLFGIIADRGENIASITSANFTSDPRTILVPQALSDQTRWSTVIWRPGDLSDLDFLGGTEDFSFQTTPSIGFCAISSSGNSQTFEFEVVEFWEFVGESNSQSVRPPDLTASHSDPVGLSRVLEGTQYNVLSADQEDWNLHTAHALVDSIAHSDSVARTVETLVGPIVKSLPLGKMVSSLIGFLGL